MPQTNAPYQLHLDVDSCQSKTMISSINPTPSSTGSLLNQRLTKQVEKTATHQEEKTALSIFDEILADIENFGKKTVTPPTINLNNQVKKFETEELNPPVIQAKNTKITETDHSPLQTLNKVKNLNKKAIPAPTNTIVPATTKNSKSVASLLMSQKPTLTEEPKTENFSSNQKANSKQTSESTPINVSRALLFNRNKVNKNYNQNQEIDMEESSKNQINNHTPKFDQSLDSANFNTKEETSISDSIIISSNDTQQEFNDNSLPPTPQIEEIIIKLDENEAQSNVSPADQSKQESVVPQTNHPPTKKSKNNSNNFGHYAIAFLVLTLILGIGCFGFYELLLNAQKAAASNNNQNLPPNPTATPHSPPKVLAFQGKITNPEGQPVTGEKILEFSLYDHDGGQEAPAVGGNLLWNSGSCTIPIGEQGLFNANLGAGLGQGSDTYNCGPDLGDIFAENSGLWLEIKIESETLFPRQMIKAVPFALNSETLQGYRPSTEAGPNNIPVINADGNLVFKTDRTSIINTGDLTLASKNGDIYLAPGSNNTYAQGNLSVSENLNVSGNTNLDGNTQINGDLEVKQNTKLDGNLVLGENSRLGIGTNNPSQKLTIKDGHLSFEFLDAPQTTALQVEKGIDNNEALSPIKAPSTPTATLIESTTGALSPENYQYAISFLTFDGKEYHETELSKTTSIIEADSTHKQVKLENIAIFPTENVVARKIYRTKGGSYDGKFYLVKTIADNFTTEYIDQTADSLLVNIAPNSNDTGHFKYRITYYNDAGETNGSAITQLSLPASSSSEASLINIPTDPTNTAKGRRIYRTLAGGSSFHLVADLSNNDTSFFIDKLSDSQLSSQNKLTEANSTSGSIFAGSKKAIQLSSDGNIITEGDLIAGKRIETNHGDNQGLKLPTSLGKPAIKTGQKTGDIVFDAANGIIYIYNGSEFLSIKEQNNMINADNSAGGTSNVCPNGQCTILLNPEYSQSVLTASGQNNAGNLTADFVQDSDTGTYHNYYQWQSSETSLQNYDIITSFIVPGDFSGWQETGITLDFATTNNDSSQNKVEVFVFKQNMDVSQYLASGERVSLIDGQWMSQIDGQTPLTFNKAILDQMKLTPGEEIFVKIRPSSKDENQVRLGALRFNYLDKNSANNNSSWKEIAGALLPSRPDQDILFGGNSTSSAKAAMLNMASGTPTMMVRGNIELTGNTGQNYLDLTSGGNLAIRTSQTLGSGPQERIVITNDGKVGIGTSAPREMLDVNGNAIISGSLTLDGMTLEQAGNCNQSVEGRIFYNLDARTFYTCRPNDQIRSSYSWQEL